MTPGPDVLALSLGDPAGIGPELIAAAWADRGPSRLPPFFAVGGARLLAAAAERVGLDVPVIAIAHPEDAREAFARGLPVLGAIDAEYRPGTPDAAGAHCAYASLQQACEIVRLRLAAALVTAPVAKSALAVAGFAFPGQTEFLASACGKHEDDAVMMLAGPSLKAVPLTVHCSLAEVPGLLSPTLIERKVRIVDTALRRDFGIDRPRIAIAGLNPHAGEQGRFGDEEQRIIAPAVAALRAGGLDVAGPIPGDALFTPRARASYDAAIAMYHDQALIPIKALDFDEGVNVTLGLPIVRTSPDHGTAFDIAGKGVAHPGAMIAAIRMAGEIAAQRGTHG